MTKRAPFFPMVDLVEGALKKAGLTYEDLDQEVIRAFTLGYDFVTRHPPHDASSYASEFEYEDLSPVDAYQKLTPEERTFLEGLTYEQRQRYLYFSGATFVWDWNLMLTEDSGWHTRNSPKKFTPVASQAFPGLQKLMAALPFEFTGRVMIMGVSPNQKVFRHTDSYRDEPLIDNVILTFQPDDRSKKVFVEDDDGTVYEPPIRGYCLDDSFPHRLEAKPYFTYSIRIEGKLLPGVREKREPDYPKYRSRD